MKHILATRHRGLLAGLARGRALLAFDFDGTLAPITPDRDTARMRPETRALLARLCSRHLVAVLSGRKLADIEQRLEGAHPAYVVGNHGIEPGADLEQCARVIAVAYPLLVRALRHRPDIDCEDKVYSLAVHYRHSSRPQSARRAILDAIAALPEPLRVVPGVFVVNGLPPQAPNKGDALLRICNIANADAALYVGDDITDEDVFMLDRPARLLSIRVGRSLRSAALCYLRNQRHMDRLLRRLIELLPRPA